MTLKYKIIERIRFVIISAVLYFCLDYFIYETDFLQCYSFVGLKSFLPVVLGLNYGIYGVLGELIAILVKTYLTGIGFPFILMECIIVVIMGIGSWFLWHIKSYTHRIHFRFWFHYVRYVTIVVFFSIVCSIISNILINNLAFEDVMIWNISMNILVGIPVEIIYAGLMNFNPVLPPLYEKGRRITLDYDIVTTLDDNPETLQKLHADLELTAEIEKIDLKRLFEIQNVIEELYLRILKHNPKSVIDVYFNYDIASAVEFLYIGKRYNPFFTTKNEDDVDMVGLNIIKHRALLSFYDYSYGLNKINLVL